MGFTYGSNVPGFLPDREPVVAESFDDARQGLLEQLAGLSRRDQLFRESPITEPRKAPWNLVNTFFALGFQRCRFVLPPTARESLKGIGKGRFIDDSDLV